jgi:NADPH:quinone reductase-like Zn-dependent oxidoreductase
MSLPSHHRALVVVEKGKVAVNEQPLPKFSDDEILVRVKAVALNPTDWKVRYILRVIFVTHVMTACRLCAQAG